MGAIFLIDFSKARYRELVSTVDASSGFSASEPLERLAGCEIITGNMIPPDFTTFWT
jgi:hypothetical protein